MTHIGISQSQRMTQLCGKWYSADRPCRIKISGDKGARSTETLNRVLRLRERHYDTRGQAEQNPLIGTEAVLLPVIYDPTVPLGKICNPNLEGTDVGVRSTRPPTIGNLRGTQWLLTLGPSDPNVMSSSAATRQRIRLNAISLVNRPSSTPLRAVPFHA